MTAQKLPLFGGIIQPVHISAVPATPAVNAIFSPPDKALKSPPRTYELHLWLMPGLVTTVGETYALLVTEIGTGKTGLAWSGVAAAGNAGIPQKILDGYPVRGAVEVALLASHDGVADAYPIGPQMFGYYMLEGQGHVFEEERRFIGQDLLKYNEGVGFLLSTVAPAPAPPLPPNTPTNAIIHEFAPGRLDEISLAFTPFPFAADAYTGVDARLSFEDANNQPLIPGHYVTFPAGAGAPFGLGVPISGAYPPSPYVIHKIPFGGDPRLHHLRVTAIKAGASEAGLGAHGYFMRH